MSRHGGGFLQHWPREAGQVNQALIIVEALRELAACDGVRTENDDVGVSQDIPEIVSQQRADVRDVGLNEVPIRSDERCCRERARPSPPTGYRAAALAAIKRGGTQTSRMRSSVHPRERIRKSSPSSTRTSPGAS